MATETELMREAIKAQGGVCDDLPDNLQSTLLKKLIETCAAGGGGGGGGGGLPTGGEPHQQLVTDKDGNAKWEDRLCYSEPMQGEVLPETGLTYVGEGEFGLLTPPTTMPVVGVNHIVVYNGASYDCVAGNHSDGGGLAGVVLGNMGALYGEIDPAGPPFVLMFMNSPVEGVYGAGLAFDGSETFTISVNINDESVKKIEPKFMPSGTIYGRVDDRVLGDNTLTAYADKAMTKQVTFAEGVKMLEEYGLRVCISLDEGLQLAFGGTHMYTVPKSACVQNENKAILVTLGAAFNGSEFVFIIFSDTVVPFPT